MHCVSVESSSNVATAQIKWMLNLCSPWSANMKMHSSASIAKMKYSFRQILSTANFQWANIVTELNLLPLCISSSESAKIVGKCFADYSLLFNNGFNANMHS